MELTKKQEEGLQIAVDRYHLNLPYTVISGFAGTGKSTLIRFIIDALGLSEEEVAYVSFTGKAAEVLRQKGCKNACTAHKLLYYSTKTIDGKFIFKPREVLDGYYKLIVVDEVSMLPIQLWEQLLSHKVYVIACGDPFQIPPIDPNSDNHVLDNPHIFLDEIMRQAADSEIIQLSMNIRNMDPIAYKNGKESMVVTKSAVQNGMYTWADQIIVGTNAKRAEINNLVRQLTGKTGGKPQIGDKVISLENHWDLADLTGESALVNGTIGYITEIEETKISYPINLKFVIGPIPVYRISIKTDTGEVFKDIIIDKKYIETGEKTLSPKQEYHIYKHRNKFRFAAPCLFNYGYAITGHRAQGSQWEKVVVVEESFPRDRIEHARWLYTSVTRAENKIILVR